MRNGTLFMETTKISAEQTISEIQRTLGEYGATAILTEYMAGQIEAVSFKVEVNGSQIPFRLPCRHDAVYQTMIRRMRKLREKRIGEYQAQAKRVAWRQILRWIQAQMALTQTGMVKVEEVFLPYMQGKFGKTLYEVMSGNNFKILEGPK